MTQPKEIVLVIDDDLDLCELLEEYLSREGFQVETVQDGAEGMEKALDGTYGAVVLDVMLPGRRNGFDLLKEIRARIDTPVLMLTAKGEDIDRIVGLELGADDYLPKPFNPRELVARLRAILRRVNSDAMRTSSGGGQKRFAVGDVEMETGTRAVFQQGRRVELTAVEFSLLEMLLLKAGTIVTREVLTRSVLGRALTPYDRSIDVHISRLRKKLGRDDRGAERIRSIRGTGYIYVLQSIHRTNNEPEQINGGKDA